MANTGESIVPESAPAVRYLEEEFEKTVAAHRSSAMQEAGFRSAIGRTHGTYLPNYEPESTLTQHLRESAVNMLNIAGDGFALGVAKVVSKFGKRGKRHDR